MQDKHRKSVSALYTAIGRGHPNYLDSTLRVLRPLCRERAIDLNITSVFAISQFPALWGWKTIRKIYQAGPQNKILSELYNKIRDRKSNSSKDSIMLRLLARDIRQYFKNYEGLILVAHPLLVQLLGASKRVIYIHGEIAAPQEFVLSRAQKIYVPLRETAQRMIAAGVPSEKIEMTGLMLEPELENKRQLIIESRHNRLKNNHPPVIGCFNSGAYPRRHVENMVKLIRQVLNNNHGRIIISAGNNKTKFEYFKNYLSEFMPCFSTKEFLNSQSGLLILHDQDREKLTLQEIKVLEHIDLLVMAAHERVNWCVGLGMPALLLTPHYGNFARQNYEFTTANALVYENPDIVRALESFLIDYRNKDTKLTLRKKRFDSNGAYNTAQSIISLLEN